MQANCFKKVSLQLVPQPLIEAPDLLVDELQTAQLVLTRISEFVDTLADDYLNVEPWSIFNAWLDSHFDDKSTSISLFRSWQFFHWCPEPATVKQSLFNESTPTIASVYAKLYKDVVSAAELAVLNSAQHQCLDLFEVVGRQANYVILYGTISQAKVVVFNTDETSKARIGEYLFANVLDVDPLRSIFLGSSPILPRECRPSVLEFCDFIKRCSSNVSRDFKNFQSDVFNLYYDLTRDFTIAR